MRNIQIVQKIISKVDDEILPKVSTKGLSKNMPVASSLSASEGLVMKLLWEFSI